jgi:glycine dehydrogenase subunit 1
MVTAATIYLSLLGQEGLARVALASAARTEELVEMLCAVDGVERLFDGPHFHERALRLDRPAGPVLDALAARGILGGFDLSRTHAELGNALLVCVTETKTPTDLETYRDALRDIMT